MMKYFKPFTTLAVGMFLGWKIVPMITSKIG